jgi:hypothetical protein
LALRAASAFGIDLTGVDLLPDGRGGWVILELNGAVDLTPEYSLGGEDVFARIVGGLASRITQRVRPDTWRTTSVPGRGLSARHPAEPREARERPGRFLVARVRDSCLIEVDAIAATRP